MRNRWIFLAMLLAAAFAMVTLMACAGDDDDDDDNDDNDGGDDDDDAAGDDDDNDDAPCGEVEICEVALDCGIGTWADVEDCTDGSQQANASCQDPDAYVECLCDSVETNPACNDFAAAITTCGAQFCP